MAIWGESAILDDGRRIIAPWNDTGIYIGEEFFDGPQLRMPDATIDSEGRVWVTAVGQKGGLYLLCDALGEWWRLPVTAFGTRAIIRAENNGCRVAVASSAFQWTSLSFNGGGSYTFQTGAIVDGSGGNGMRDWLGGTPRSMQPLDATLLTHPARAAMSAGSVTIASSLSGQDQVLIAKDGKLGTLYLGLVPWQAMRLSSSGTYWIGTRYDAKEVVGGPIPAMVPPLATEPIPSIIRPIWVGTFNFTPHDSPGNCVLNTNDLIVRTKTGKPVMAYCAGNPEGSLTALNQAIVERLAIGLPVLAYWPRGLQQGPIPDTRAIVGVEAYWPAGWTEGQFEASLSTALIRCPSAVIIAQAYTEHNTLTKDINAVVPVVARVANARQNVVGILAFSGWGRPTGLQDHPDTLALWQRLADTVPGQPAEIIDVTTPPKITVISYTKPFSPDGFHMVASIGNSTTIEVTTKNGSWYLKATNDKGSDQTATVRPVA